MEQALPAREVELWRERQSKFAMVCRDQGGLGIAKHCIYYNGQREYQGLDAIWWKEEF
jgi:hypothetical protein